MRCRCRPRAGLLAAAVLAACGGEAGTILVDVVGPPGSDLLDRVVRARVRLSSPDSEFEAERGADGTLALELDVPADGGGGVLTVDGFDLDGERIATGASPALPIAAVDASISIYLGPPGQLSPAPVDLDPARTDVGIATLPYGAVLAGGRGPDGQPLADLLIYNVYDHVLQIGLDLPAPRAAPTVMTGESDYVYILGGEDASGQASGDAWRFDTTVAPAGAYLEVATPAEAARIARGSVYAGAEAFLVLGDPALLLSGTTLATAAYDDAPDLGEAAGALITGGPSYLSFLAGAGAGPSGAVLFQAGVFEELALPDPVTRTGHAVVPLSGGRALVVGGQDSEGTPLASGLVYHAITDEFDSLPELLERGRKRAAVASTFEVVVVAGGVDADGQLLDDAEVLDAETLEHVATIAMVVPRQGAVAVPLANGQVLIGGGVDVDGQPVATLELYTPSH